MQIQAPILWHCCSQSGADGSFENGAKIQSDVDAGAVREMQPTEQIAIKINGHISNILSRPGQKFSIKNKEGLLRPYCPYFIRYAFFNFRQCCKMKSVFQDCVFGCFYLYLKEMDPRQSFIVGDIRRDICHQVELGRYWERKWLLPGPTALAFQLPTINGDQQNMRKNWWQSKERKRENIQFKSEQSEGTGILVAHCNALTIVSAIKSKRHFKFWVQI